MPRHKQSKKVKGARPPRKLLAWRKRIRRGRPAELYHGAMIPMFKLKDKRHREVRDMVRAHHDKKLAVKKGA